MTETLEFLHTVNTFIAEKILYLLLAVLLLNMLQRRYRQHAQKKRFATLYIGLLILALMVGSVLIVTLKLPDILIVPLLAVLIVIGYRFRNKVFPFRLNCEQCGQKLNGKRIAFFDSNRCEHCDPQG
jgi:hypothetical protein